MNFPGKITRLSTIPIGVVVGGAIVFLVSFLYSSGFPGPLFLSDEIGYLTKAAYLGGYNTYLETKWHLGYPLFLTPLVVMLNDPYSVWRGVQVLNCVLTTCSYCLVIYIVCRFYNVKVSQSIVNAALVGCLLPSVIVMTGYAFTGPAVSFVFLMSLAFLLSQRSFATSILGHATFSGFLFWLHPVGIGAVASSLIVLFTLMVVRRERKILLLASCIPIVMVLFYHFWVHPTVNESMRGLISTTTSQYSEYKKLFGLIGRFEFWSFFALMLTGQLSALIISSFGLTVYAVGEGFSTRFWRGSRIGATFSKTRVFAGLYLGFTLLGVLIIASIATTTYAYDQAYQHLWVHGRYIEPFVIVLIAIGAVSRWNGRRVTSAILVLVVSATVFHFFDPIDYTQLFLAISAPSFWPRWLFTEGRLSEWILIGASCTLFIYLVGKRFAWVVVLPIVLYVVAESSIHHYRVYKNYSDPDGLVDFIRYNFADVDCVGWDIVRARDVVVSQRRQLYSFYFYDLGFRPMSYDEWKSSCNGPFLSQAGYTAKVEDPGKIIARDSRNMVQVIVRKQELGSIDVKPFASDLFVDISGLSPCVYVFCIHLDAVSLSRYSQIGKIENGLLVANSIKGFLFYGPYAPLTPGSYNISIDLVGNEVGSSILEVVSHEGKVIHETRSIEELQLSSGDSEQIDLVFHIDEEVTDMQVRLRIFEEVAFGIRSLTISRNML